MRLEAARVQVDALGRHIARDPSDPTLYAARTRARLRAGDLRGVLPDLAKRVELKPDDSETAYAHCLIALHLGEHDTYRHARRAMLLRFSDTDALEDGERVAKATLPSPRPASPSTTSRPSSTARSSRARPASARGLK